MKVQLQHACEANGNDDDNKNSVSQRTFYKHTIKTINQSKYIDRCKNTPNKIRYTCCINKKEEKFRYNKQNPEKIFKF